MKLPGIRWNCWLLAIVVASGCQVQKSHNLPPAERLLAPGPGVAGPGPGVIRPPGGIPGPMLPGGPVGCDIAGAGIASGLPASSQIAFIGPDGMQLRWDVGMQGAFDSEPLVVPGRQNFGQAAIYRLKLTDIPGRPGVELYPTMELGATTPRTDAYLAHNAIPVQFTEEDLDQVQSGNFVTKVIYLPDPEFQELALAGVETLVSTRLDPGVDPIVEADRRGSIMAIVRLGNKDLEVPGSEMTAESGILPVGHAETTAAAAAAVGSPAGVPIGVPPSAFVPPAAPPNVAGVTAPQWGMPMTGTPIGLPGPPHIPLGAPAGLKKHVIRNHTHVHLPKPVEKFKIDVKQRPGMSYPRPVNRVKITEQTKARRGRFHIPFWNHNEIVR